MTWCVTVVNLFQPSVTVSVMVNVPPAAYVCAGEAEVLRALPSPKFHEYLIWSPFGSLVPALLVWQTRPVQVAVKVAVGATLVAGSVIVTVRVVLAALPQPSVVVSVIV